MIGGKMNPINIINLILHIMYLRGSGFNPYVENTYTTHRFIN